MIGADEFHIPGEKTPLSRLIATARIGRCGRWPRPGERQAALRRLPIVAATIGLAGLLPAGCAPTIQALGDPVNGLAGVQSIAMPDTADGAVNGPAEAAVQAALASAGVTISAEAPQRIELGFAIAEPKVVLSFADGRPAVPAGGKPAFCRARTYTLSLAIIDRETGAVRVRARARTARCGSPAVTEVLPALAEAAVRKIRS